MPRTQGASGLFSCVWRHLKARGIVGDGANPWTAEGMARAKRAQEIFGNNIVVVGCWEQCRERRVANIYVEHGLATLLVDTRLVEQCIVVCTESANYES